MYVIYITLKFFYMSKKFSRVFDYYFFWTGICRNNICNRCNGINGWSSNIPQTTKRLPIQKLTVICSTPLRPFRYAGFSIRSPLEYIHRNPRLLLRYNGRMHFTHRQQNPVDADDRFEQQTLSSWN